MTSPSLTVIPELQKQGANIHAYDPEGVEEAKHLLNNITYGSSSYEIMDDADLAVIITEWHEFRALDLERMKSMMKNPILVDLRNIYTPKEMVEAGFQYNSIGRSKVVATETLKIAKG